MDSNMTVLRLLSVGLPPYSARGITQTLKPIGASASLRRDVNGTLKDTSDPIFRKYESAITGSDVAPPNFEAWWPGMEVTVHCAAFLSRVATTDDDPDATDLEVDRPPVPGSVYVEEGLLIYRPVLIMLVTDWNQSESEWTRGVAWSIGLEEK